MSEGREVAKAALEWSQDKHNKQFGDRATSDGQAPSSTQRRDGRSAPMNENGRRGDQAQKIINVLVAIMLAVFGWMGNTVWSIVQTQQAQLTQLNIELAKNYMPRVELQQQLDRMAAQLERIAQQTSKP